MRGILRPSATPRPLRIQSQSQLRRVRGTRMGRHYARTWMSKLWGGLRFKVGSVSWCQLWYCAVVWRVDSGWVACHGVPWGKWVLVQCAVVWRVVETGRLCTWTSWSLWGDIKTGIHLGQVSYLIAIHGVHNYARSSKWVGLILRSNCDTAGFALMGVTRAILRLCTIPNAELSLYILREFQISNPPPE